jgi:hypothetical protein
MASPSHQAPILGFRKAVGVVGQCLQAFTVEHGDRSPPGSDQAVTMMCWDPSPIPIPERNMRSYAAVARPPEVA